MQIWPTFLDEWPTLRIRLEVHKIKKGTEILDYTAFQMCRVKNEDGGQMK